MSSGDTAECWGRGFVFDLEDGLTPGGVWSRKRHDDSQGFLVVPVTFQRQLQNQSLLGLFFPFLSNISQVMVENSDFTPSQVGCLFTFLARQLAKPNNTLFVNRTLFDQASIPECV